ncbi:MAG: hypothetical protein ABEH47_05425 [Haloferacaceae archaeon]
MVSEFATVYLGIMFLNFVYMVGLLYGGIWYTRQTTVECPECGVRYPKYRIDSHECHPSLVDDDKPWHNYGD